VQPLNSTDTTPPLEIDNSIKPSDTIQVKVKEITHEIEPPVNMPLYTLPHAFISSTIPALSPADTMPSVENQTHTKPSEVPKGKEDIKVKEITREYMDKVLEEKARVEHDEEAGGIETGHVKSLYEELVELKGNSRGVWGSPPPRLVIKPADLRNDGPRGSHIFMECRETKKEEVEKAMMNWARSVEKQRADPWKDTSELLQTVDEDSLSVEASDKIEKWKWVFYTGDKGGEIRTKIPVSPRGTPIHYDLI
jgi:hypothetical protein